MSSVSTIKADPTAPSATAMPTRPTSFLQFQLSRFNFPVSFSSFLFPFQFPVSRFSFPVFPFQPPSVLARKLMCSLCFTVFNLHLHRTTSSGPAWLTCGALAQQPLERRIIPPHSPPAGAPHIDAPPANPARLFVAFNATDYRHQVRMTILHQPFARDQFLGAAYTKMPSPGIHSESANPASALPEMASPTPHNLPDM